VSGEILAPYFFDQEELQMEHVTNTIDISPKTEQVLNKFAIIFKNAVKELTRLNDMIELEIKGESPKGD